MIGKRHNYRQKRTARMLTSAAMACMLAVLAVVPSLAATARATTMKLEKTEGTVTLKTQNGTSRKPTNGMRLLNGNTIETAASSYAHISLDSSKAVKLDQNTSTTVRQSGKQLELLVKSGQLFFNVSEKLTQKESLNIRTSSMVTGIRGTCGVVEKVNPAMSKLYLIEGKVTLGTGENATTIYGGQTATVVLRPKDETGESGGSGDNGNTEKDMEQKVYVEKLTEKAMPVFAITEILSNPVLQQKIEKTTELKIKILEEVLKESQNPEETEEKKEEEQKPEETTSSGGSYGGSSGGGVSDSPNTPGAGDAAGPVEEIVPVEITVTGGAVTVDEINKAWASGENAIVKLTARTSDSEQPEDNVGRIDLDGSISIPEKKTLILDGGTELSCIGIEVGSGGTMTIVSGAQLTCNMGITNNGIIENNGTLVSELDVTLASGSQFENNGEIAGPVTIKSGGTLDNNGTIEGGVRLSEDDQADGQTSIKTTIRNAVGKELTAGGDWNVSNAIIENAGSIDMGANAIVVTESLTLSQVGTITGNGNKVISLVGGGTLTLGSDSSSGGSISNTSEDNASYAIAVGDGSSIELKGKGQIATISTGTNQIANTIQGLNCDEVGKVTGGENILKNDAQGYNLNWDNENHVLKLTIPQ